MRKRSGGGQNTNEENKKDLDCNPQLKRFLDKKVAEWFTEIFTVHHCVPFCSDWVPQNIESNFSTLQNSNIFKDK